MKKGWYHLTQAHKDAISLAHKGKKKSFTAEHCANISRAMKGKKKQPFTKEHCQAISDAKKGIPLSAEHRQKLIEARRRKSEEVETEFFASIHDDALDAHWAAHHD